VVAAAGLLSIIRRAGIGAIWSTPAGARESSSWAPQLPRLVAQVREVGFANVWDLGPEEVNSRYCAGRPDGLR